MKIIVPMCILCEAEDVQLWTLDNNGVATVTYVCTRHAAPLQEILDASEGLPLDLQVPVAKKTAKLKARNESLLKRPRRSGGMEPLDWTPPSEKVVSPAVVSSDVGLAVEFSDDAAEVRAGGDGDDLGVAGAGEVHDLGLQPLEGGDALDGLEHEGRRPGQVSLGDVVVDQVEVA